MTNYLLTLLPKMCKIVPFVKDNPNRNPMFPVFWNWKLKCY